MNEGWAVLFLAAMVWSVMEFIHGCLLWRQANRYKAMAQAERERREWWEEESEAFWALMAKHGIERPKPNGRHP